MAKTTPITCTVDGKIRLDRNAILSVILRPGLKDNRISVISIYRDRRTADVNADILHEYFQTKRWEREQFAIEIETSQDASKREDKCEIRIWDDLIMTETESGEKIGFLIMESIGDLSVEEIQKDHDCVKLLAWSLLASSIQVVSIQQTIQKKNLENLQMSMNYATAIAAKKATSLKLHSVKLLVQNWVDTNKHRHGLKGGNDYLKELSCKRETSDIVKKLSSTHENMECFLLPHRRFQNTNGNFYCNNRDVETGFGGQVLSFGDTLVKHLERLKDTKAPMEIFKLLTHFDQLFDSSILPEPTTVIQEASKLHYENAYNEGFTKYDRTMKIRTKAAQYDELWDIHSELTMNTLKEYDSTPKIGSDSSRSEFRDKLSDKCKKIYKQYEDTAIQKMSEAEKQLVEITDREMSKYISEIDKRLTGTMTEGDFEMHHKRCYLGAISFFRSKTSTSTFERCEKLKNKFNEKMLNDIQEYYKGLKNRKQNQQIQNQLAKLMEEMTKQYQKRISDHSTKGIPDKKLQEEHMKISKLIVPEFCKKACYAPNAMVKRNQGTLEDKIRALYLVAINENRNKNKRKLDELLNIVSEAYQQKIDEKAKGIAENQLQVQHNQISSLVTSKFNEKASSISSSDVVDQYRQTLRRKIDAMYDQARRKNRRLLQSAAEQNQIVQRLMGLENLGLRQEPRGVVMEQVEIVRLPGGRVVTREVKGVFIRRGGR